MLVSKSAPSRLPTTTDVKPAVPVVNHPVQAPAAGPADAFARVPVGSPAERPAVTAQSAALPAGTLRGPMAARMSQLDGNAQSARESLKTLATDAAVNVMAQQDPNAPVKGDHPLLEGFGETLGLALGVVVTQALALIPSWNAPVLDPNGKPVSSVPGAERQGDHDIRKRHQEVVGPQITALVERMPPSLVREVLEGLGRGATEAPGATYRLESAVSDAFSKL